MAESTKTGNQEFGDLLREAREDRGMSRRDLAEATGLSYPYISQLETGYRLPSPSAIKTLSRVLQVSLDAIFAAITHPSEHPPAAPRRRAPPTATNWVDNRSFAAPTAGESAATTATAGSAAGGGTGGARGGGASNAAGGRVGGAAAGGVAVPGASQPAAAQFAAARPSAPDDPWAAPRVSTPVDDDVLPVVMDLLLRLPPDDRLHALAQIQTLVIDSVIREKT